jgi:HD-GYP domain-containing protein (c-di-GMP phosphodiesterase class II)
MASILTLADSYDAMTSQRSYNSPRSTDDALKELDRCSGTQFDPQLVEAFKRIAKALEQAANDPTGP